MLETKPNLESGTLRVKTGFAEMFKGGVIMDVVTPEQAIIAEKAGATAVMALERVPADIRRDGGVARMSDPDMIISSRRRFCRRSVWISLTNPRF
jgi:pyridoxal 5'-phosphate synthase pdxS subunit